MLKGELLTVKEVATYLRVSRVTVWRWCKQGLIPASRVGRNWRIRRQDMIEFFSGETSGKTSSTAIEEPLKPQAQAKSSISADSLGQNNNHKEDEI